MTKKLLLVTAPLLFTIALSVHAQEHSFKKKRVSSLASSELASLKGQSVFGRITDKNKRPLADVIVHIKGTQLHSITNEEGIFQLTNLSGEDITLEVMSMGFKSQDVLVKLDAEKPVACNLILVEQAHHLQSVEVVGRNERSYKNTLSFVATKTETPLKDIPQSVGYVTKELVRDQGATTVNDVVKNISGVNQYTTYNDFSIRGFRTTGNRNSGNLVNGMRAQTSLWRQQSIANIERVEIIKGPASTLFGNAAPGGVINRVTKKPLTYHSNSVSTTIGSFNTLNTYADFTGPLDTRETLLYRLNLGYEHTDTFRDLQETTNYIVAPSFSFLPSKNTQFNVDIFYQYNKGKLDRGQSIFGDGDLSSVPISRSLSATNDYLNEKLMNTTLGLTHRFSDKLSLNITYQNSSYDESLREHNQGNAYVKLADGKQSPSRILMVARQRERYFRNNSLNTYLNYELNTGALRHRILLGYDYFQMELKAGSSEMSASGYLLKAGGASNAFKPADIAKYLLDKDGNPRTNVPYYDLTTNSGNVEQDYSKYIFSNVAVTPYLQYSHGVYVQDQMEIGRVKFLLGLRQEYFTDLLNYKDAKEKKTTQTALIPRLGAVLSITKDLNLYGTWIRGFEPQSASVQSNPKAGGPFDPEQSELFEAGLKGEWFSKRLSTTLSTYHLKKNNTLYNAGDDNNPDLLEQVGEEVSKGIELDVAGFITPSWSLVTNYAYTDAAITRTKTNTEKDFGMQRPNTPKHAFNIWSKYIFLYGPLKNFGLGLGFNAVSQRYGQVGKRENTIVYPGYGLVNAALYYRLRNLQVQLNVDNVLDKTYWVGGYDKLRSFPGTPRNIKVAVSYRF